MLDLHLRVFGRNLRRGPETRSICCSSDSVCCVGVKKSNCTNDGQRIRAQPDEGERRKVQPVGKCRPPVATCRKVPSSVGKCRRKVPPIFRDRRKASESATHFSRPIFRVGKCHPFFGLFTIAADADGAGQAAGGTSDGPSCLSRCRYLRGVMVCFETVDS